MYGLSIIVVLVAVWTLLGDDPAWDSAGYSGWLFTGAVVAIGAVSLSIEVLGRKATHARECGAGR
jgi:hypothetical protein